MFFDDDENEKKLFEDIQFKRRVAFVDDDNVINIDLKPFSKISQTYKMVRVTQRSKMLIKVILPKCLKGPKCI